MFHGVLKDIVTEMPVPAAAGFVNYQVDKKYERPVINTKPTVFEWGLTGVMFVLGIGGKVTRNAHWDEILEGSAAVATADAAELAIRWYRTRTTSGAATAAGAAFVEPPPSSAGVVEI